MMLSGWGRFPRQACAVARPRDEDELRALVARGGAIARGNGRSYGDSAMSQANTVDMTAFDRMIAFDPQSGQLVVEAGVLLADVITSFLPRGWFPAVVPGTKHVTIGGMVAADVHGKNHHGEGSFGNFVDWLDVMGADGIVRRASRDAKPELFAWTIGSMGLGGVVLRVAFRLRPVETALVRQTTIPCPDLNAAIDSIEAHQCATYSVAWIDCLASGAALGRSLVMLGEHAARAELPVGDRHHALNVAARRQLPFPVDPPASLVNGLSVRAFNALYFRVHSRKAPTRLVDWDGFFFPLDAVRDWNRLYGRKGFAQFQCALPLAAARTGLRQLLEVISAAGSGSFLAVLKRFAPQESRFSFPMEGFTLALDFPATARSLALMSRLDDIVLAHGGRFYLAKDSRMTAATLAASDDRVVAFRRMRQESGNAAAFASAQSERLEL